MKANKQRPYKIYKDGLYDKLISEDNIISAIKKSCKHLSKKHKKDKFVRAVKNNPEQWVVHFRWYVENYYPHKRKPIEIYDGISKKKRLIVIPTFEEKVMQHMVVNVLEPIIKRGMYHHVNGSIPGTGAARGRKYIQRWIRTDRRNTKYCCKMDISDFFGSISHPDLRLFLSFRIRDIRFLLVLYNIIACTDVGLPLGFHTSHWLANWYLQDLDHYIKQNLRAKYYSRYMDDMVIFGANKKKLHYFRCCISNYLEEKKTLIMKANWQIFRFVYKTRFGKEIGRYLDFMGFRFYRDRTILRRNTMLKMTRRARRISKKNYPTIHDCRRMISAVGLLNQTDTYNMYLTHIKLFADFHWIKRRISSYDRKQRKVLMRKAA